MVPEDTLAADAVPVKRCVGGGEGDLPSRCATVPTYTRHLFVVSPRLLEMQMMCLHDVKRMLSASQADCSLGWVYAYVLFLLMVPLWLVAVILLSELICSLVNNTCSLTNCKNCKITDTCFKLLTAFLSTVLNLSDTTSSLICSGYISSRHYCFCSVLVRWTAPHRAMRNVQPEQHWTHTRQRMTRAGKIIKDIHRLHNKLFQWLPSGKSLCSCVA